nr:sugar phosphate isomerase/epimerase family protein [Candidatus Njordarchaeum guaymaensis]
MFVPAHTIWLLNDKDIKARLNISKEFLRDASYSSIGFEALQKVNSFSKSKRDAQVSKTRRIRRDLSSEGAETFFSVHTPYTPIERFCLASESPVVRRKTIEAVKKCVELAEDIGAQIVNTHPGGIVEITSDGFKNPSMKRATLDRLKESLADLVAWLEGRGVTLSVENVPYPLEEIVEGYSPLIGIFPGDLLELVSDIDSRNLRVTIDFCHLWITHKTLGGYIAIRNNDCQHEDVSITDYRGLSSYETEAIESLATNPFDAFVKSLCEKVAHIHVADSDGVYIPGKSRVYEGKSLGEGDLNLDALANSLREIERCSRRTGPMMIVLEAKEANLAEPTNSLKSLSKLAKLIRKENVK